MMNDTGLAPLAARIAALLVDDGWTTVEQPVDINLITFHNLGTGSYLDLRRPAAQPDTSFCRIDITWPYSGGRHQNTTVRINDDDHAIRIIAAILDLPEPTP